MNVFTSPEAWLGLARTPPVRLREAYEGSFDSRGDEA